MSDNTTSSVTMRVARNGLLLMGGRLLFKNKLLVPRRRRSTRQIGARRRCRMQVDDIYQQLGPRIFRQAYRMTYTSFKRLHRKLRLRILEGLSQQPGGNYRFIPNGKITTSVRLACALRYFAGGSPYDLMTTYQIGLIDVYRSVWTVVSAVNKEMPMKYPTCPMKQEEIAAGFAAESEAGFDCCAGAIDGILIWLTQPSQKECKSVGCSSAKFFCSRKHKFGMNCQAVCDVRGRFLDMSIVYPGSTSDCLAFEGMTLFSDLEGGILRPGLCLFGDNAYINSIFMATPFAGVSGGSEDAYNFYHSQVRIRIECAFGMFTQRWSLLRRALPAQITTCKAVALVVALGKLHNFCIDENDGDATPLQAADEWNLQVEGAIPAADVEPLPIELLDGGNHFDDVDQVTRRRLVRRGNMPGLPRHVLHDLVSTANLTRPNLTRTRTNN